MSEKEGGAQSVAFKARMRGDRLRVQLRVEVLFDLDQAAAALAIELPDMPPWFGLKTVARMLRQAVRNGTYGRRLAKADRGAKELYRAKLLELGVFAGGGGGDAGARGRAEALVPTRIRGKRETASFLRSVFFDLDQAAAALAIELPESSVGFGKRTVQDALRRVAARGVSAEALASADATMTAHYRSELLRLGIFDAA